MYEKAKDTDSGIKGIVTTVICTMCSCAEELRKIGLPTLAKHGQDDRIVAVKASTPKAR